MNLPVSWLSLGAIPAVPALGKVAKMLSHSAQQAFGNHLHEPVPSGNGPSAINPSTSPKSKSKASGDKLADELKQIVNRLRQSLGFDQEPLDEPLEIESTGDGFPSVLGPSPLQEMLRDHLRGHPELVERFNQHAREELDQDPLRWIASSPGGVPSRVPFRMKIV
jgi:hypothetical protein